MSTPEQRRRNPRFACHGPAEVRFVVEDAPVSAKILNISAEGALIVLLEPRLACPGTRVELAFTVNHLPFRVRADLKVIRPGDTEMGFQFYSLSHRMLAQIQDVVEELAVAEGVHILRLAPLH